MKVKKIIGGVLFLIFIILAFLDLNLFLKKQKYQKINQEIKLTAVNKNYQQSTPSRLKYFYEPKANLKLREYEPNLKYWYSLTVNADHLNERFDYSTDKKEGIFRIVTLGDSFTFGSQVDTQNNYSEQLEDLLNQTLSCSDIEKFEVINLGVWGYDMEFALERYLLRGQKYQADMLFWLINEWNARIILDKLKELETQNIPAESNTESQEYYTKIYRKYTVRYSQIYVSEYLQKIISENSVNLPPKVILAPFWGRAEIKKMLKNVISRNNIYYFDRLPELWLSDDLIPNDGHPTKKGHRLLAESILLYLKEIFLKDCQLTF